MTRAIFALALLLACGDDDRSPTDMSSPDLAPIEDSGAPDEGAECTPAGDPCPEIDCCPGLECVMIGSSSMATTTRCE